MFVRIISVMAGLTLLAVVGLALSAKSEPRPCKKYTIWSGNSVVSYGTDAESIETVNGFYVIGKTMIPEHSVSRIEINQCKEPTND